ncbi:hypothetical protein BC829DRAFT_488868 [Chytridium lagenaria]|nr:hypothetical protein BC829DRAFT_488868 [Chytridium lagenaria]
MVGPPSSVFPLAMPSAPPSSTTVTSQSGKTSAPAQGILLTATGGVAKKPRKPVVPKATACDTCYRLKRKCDTKLPICGLCRRTTAECTYIRRFVSPSLIQRKQKSERDDDLYSKALEQRLEAMEKTIRTLLSGLKSSHTPPCSNPSTPPNTQLPATIENSASFSVPSSQPRGTFVDNFEMAYKPYEMYPKGMEEPAPFTSEEDTILASAFPFFKKSPSATPLPFHQAQEILTECYEPLRTDSHEGSHVTNEWVDLMEAAFDTQMGSKDQMLADGSIGLEEMDPITGEILDYEAPKVQVFPLPTSQSKYFAGTIVVNGNHLVLADGDLDADLEVFFELNRKMPLAFLNEDTIRNDILNSATGLSSCPAMVLTICSVAAASGESPDGSRWPYPGYATLPEQARSEEFFSAAVAALDFDRPSVEMCQTLLILVIYCGFISNNKAGLGWLLGGMAMRLIPHLRLNVDPDILEIESRRKWTTLEKETRRRVFYLAMVIDMMDMIFRERSTGMWKRKSSVKTPMSMRMWHSIDFATGEPTAHSSHNDPDLMTHAIELMEIICKVVAHHVGKDDHCIESHFCASQMVDTVPSDMMMSDEEVFDPDFALLDHDLSTWQKSLPEWMQSMDSYSQFSMGANYAGGGIPSYVLIKIFLYSNACTLTLHRPRMVKAVTAIIRYRKTYRHNTSLFPQSSFSHTTNTSDASFFHVLSILPPNLNPHYLKSFQSCSEASRSIIQFLSKKFEIVDPNPIASGMQPAAVFSELAKQELFMKLDYIILFDEGTGKREERSATPLETFLEMDIEAAKLGLAIARRILGNIAERWKAVEFMCQMLDRLAIGVGVGELPVIPLSFLGERG